MLLAVLLCASINPVGAQVNIEASRAASDGVGTSGVFEFGLTLRAGNVELLEFGPAFRLDRRTSAAKQLLLVNGDLGWEGGERFTNNALGHFRHEWVREGLFRPEFFIQANYDLARSLEFRALGGGGLRFRILGDDSTPLFLGVSYMLEHERNDLVASDVHPARTTDHRASLYSSVGAQGAVMAYSGVIYVQPRIPGLDDVRVLVTSRLGVAVSERIEVVTTVRFRFDDGPPDRVGRVDLQLVSGFSVSF